VRGKKAPSSSTDTAAGGSRKKRTAASAASAAAFGAVLDTNTEVYNPFKKEDETAAAAGSTSKDHDDGDNEEKKTVDEEQPPVTSPVPPPPAATAENVILRLNVKQRSTPSTTGIQPMDSAGASIAPYEPSSSSAAFGDGHHQHPQQQPQQHPDEGGAHMCSTTTRRRPFAYNEFESPLAHGGGNIDRYAHYGGGGCDGGHVDIGAGELGPRNPAASQAALAPPPLRKMRLLMELEEKSKSGEWPASSSVHCYWCCHRFLGMPYGLPHRYDNSGRFVVTGCFCSLECAAAYNFHGDTSCSADEMWSRYSLINMLAARLRDAEEEEGVVDGNEGMRPRPPSSRNCIVKQAPHRLSLSIFGGGLSIDEFRSSFQRGRRTLLHAPPMVSTCQQVEEITDGDVYSVNHFIPVDTERIDRYQEQMRLKRNKPLAGSKKNIIKMMNIQFTNR